MTELFLIEFAGYEADTLLHSVTIFMGILSYFPRKIIFRNQS